MNKYIENRKKELIYNKNLLVKSINKINKNTPLKKVQKIINAMVNTGTGIYSSYKLENYFLNKAEEIKTDENVEYEKNSILHVLTKAYITGGHTRVVERWIQVSPENERHSVYLIDQSDDEIPDLLKQVTKEKNGNFIIDNSKGFKNKAAALRKEAMKYEKIVLHIHMDDYIPIAAFGTEKFKRPVILYNHADHLGWVGVSIADVVAELRQYGMDITKNKRHVTKHFKTGIPVLSGRLESDKIDRKSLNISEDKTIILTFASKVKFIPIDDINIFKVIKDITSKYSNVVFIMIGISKSEYYIKQQHINPDQLILKGSMKHEELMKYLRTSDIVLDSFPMAGSTAILDAVYAEKPVVSGCSFVGQLDFLMKSKYYLDNVSGIISMLEELINSEEKRKENIKELKNLLNQHDSIECFKKNVKELYSILPQQHSIHKFETEHNDENNFIECDIFRNRLSTKTTPIISSKYVSIFLEKNRIAMWIRITLFNKDLKINYKKRV